MITRAPVLVAVALLAFAPSLFASDAQQTVGQVQLCLSLSRDELPVWGTMQMVVVARNKGDTPDSVSEPRWETEGFPWACAPEEWAPPIYRTVTPHAPWYYSATLGAPPVVGQPRLGERLVRATVSVNLDGDFTAEKTVTLEASYRVVEPPARVLTLAQERGEEVERCLRGVGRVKVQTVPWGKLDIERQAAVRDRIGLPAPPMSPEESAKRMGRTPDPKDPADRKRLEDALRTDPEYQEWHKLRASMGLYANFNYDSAIRAVLSYLRDGWKMTEDAYSDQWGGGLKERTQLVGGAGPLRINRAVGVFLEQGKPAALAHLDAIAKEALRCADRAFLEDVRAIVVAAPDTLTYKDVVWEDTKR